MTRRGYLCAAVALAGLAWGCRPGSPSPAEFLEGAWDRYRALYLSEEGYVLDRRRDGGTVTSEGQGYALLRALWEEDAATFHRVFLWTEEHLKRGDGLHAWLWSPRDGGQVVDANTATDADQEIAWALALAADRFGRPEYRDRAREILQAVRRHAAVDLPGGWFPAAGNWAVAERVVNLSYFVPYAYPHFHALDPEGGWDEVAGRGYELIDAVLAGPEVRLVPDFLSLDSQGRPRGLPGESGLSEVFSFDAVRLFWRVEADCVLTGRERACADPLDAADAARILAVDGRIVTRYAPDGEPLSDESSLSFYGALLPALRRHAPEVAATLLDRELTGSTLGGLVDAEMRYYDHNWVWFGLALDRGLIADRTPSAPGAGVRR